MKFLTNSFLNHCGEVLISHVLISKESVHNFVRFNVCDSSELYLCDLMDMFNQ